MAPYIYPANQAPRVKTFMHMGINSSLVLIIGRTLKIFYSITIKLSEVRHKQNVTSPQYGVHVQFLQDILLQYMCSQFIPSENQIEMKTKEINFSLFYFHFNYVVDRHNATALARDKQYCGNGDSFK